eukprot:COSAG06_NODE_20483_length_794_cov_0.671942_1_plen_195_part_10
MVFDCQYNGKERQLKVAQMNIMLFDDTGTKPQASWLYEQLEGWEYDEKKQVLSLKVKEGSDAIVYHLNMSSAADGHTALDAIQTSVQDLVTEKKRLRKEAKAKKAAAAAGGSEDGGGNELQERINKALNDSVEDIEEIAKVFADATTARHVHPSVILLQKKLSALEAAKQEEEEESEEEEEESGESDEEDEEDDD